MVGSFKTFLIKVAHVLRHNLATPGALISVYRVLTVLIPCSIYSYGVFSGYFAAAPAAPAALPPNLSLLSLSRISLIRAFSFASSAFSLFYYSIAFVNSYSSAILFAAASSLSALFLFASFSRAYCSSSFFLRALI